MTARRGHQGRRARLHSRGPPLTSPPPRRPQKAPPLRPPGAARPGCREGEGRGSARAGGGAGPGGRRRAARAGGAGVGGARAGVSRPLTLLARSRRPLPARGRLPTTRLRRRRGAARVSPDYACAREGPLAPPFFFFSPAPSRGPGQIIGERKLGSCQSLGGWVGLGAGRGWVV